MNLKQFDRKTRNLVESLIEPAMAAEYEITDVEQDGDTVTVTFSRDVGFAHDADEDEDED